MTPLSLHHKAFKFREMDDGARHYAQDAIITLSGLYGCLRPLDSIREVSRATPISMPFSLLLCFPSL
jgi:cytoplasmic iron level regulating protein YaaA (DUF328/UPF0246 family)